MSTEVMEPPAPPESPKHDFSEAAAFFDKEMGREPDAAPAKVEQVPETKTETKPEIAKPESEFPEELMTGVKPEVKIEEPTDDILKSEPPPNLSKKGTADWHKMREAIAKTAAERDAFKKEIEEVRAKPAVIPDETTATELKAARERLAEMEQSLERASFERSSKFQVFVASEKANIEGAKSFLEGAKDADGENIDPSVIDRAVALTGVKRLDVLRKAGLDPETIAAVVSYLTNVDGINRQKEQMLANHKQTAAQWEAQEKQAQEVRKAQEQAEDDRIYKTVGVEVATKFEPFQKVNGHEKWNAQVDALTAQAQEFFSGNMPVEKLAEIAYYGVGARVIHSMFHSQRAELRAAREELSKIKAAQPGGGEEVKKTTAVEEAKLDPFERSAKEFERQLGRA